MQRALSQTGGADNRYHDKWFVVWGIITQSLVTDYTNIYRENRIYFESKEGALASIETHEKEWKVFLGAKDEG